MLSSYNNECKRQVPTPPVETMEKIVSRSLAKGEERKSRIEGHSIGWLIYRSLLLQPMHLDMEFEPYFLILPILKYFTMYGGA